MVEDKEGFLYPKVDKDLCSGCNKCEKVCPILCGNTNENRITAFAAYNKNETERLNSASGGVFPLLAKEILALGGVVFGASFNENKDVNHVAIDTEKELIKLQGSKYIQSVIGNTYNIAEKLLKDGKYVYFSGTPCQIEGLLSYLGKKYDNLITQDCICHGVPSKAIWHNYLSGFEIVDNISFRDKSTGWSSYSLRIGNDLIRANNSAYMKAFIQGYSIRPSCFECKFKKKERISDITLGDLWGADIIAPELNDNKGLSLVVVNTLKGKELFDKIQHNIVCKQISIDEAIRYNSSYIVSTNRPHDREGFFCDAETNSINILIKRKYCHATFVERIKDKIKSFFSIN